jgi:hypothetical protein
MEFKIPRIQLDDLGFIEVTENLFMKQIDIFTRLYRDYRNSEPCSYGYYRSHPVDKSKFKEFAAIEKIERVVNGPELLIYAM